jgi:uncharacterized protein (DUF305 family)
MTFRLGDAPTLRRVARVTPPLMGPLGRFLVRRLALLLLLVLALGASGCSSSADDPGPAAEAGDPSPSSEIVQPGRPGESNETLPPDSTVEAAPTGEPDVIFMQMMVPHHAQALEMSALARTRAESESVQSLARRIEGAQGPEIQSMTGWLQARGIEVPETAEDVGDHAGHTDHEAHGEAMTMSGMLTDDQMRRLARSRGREFDRLFLAGMIRHHEGAIEMAGVALEQGSDMLALELAADVAAGQQAEIQRMRELQRQL